MSNLPINITFYGSRGAPNPRRVEIFFAEHKLYENQHYQYVEINMGKLEHKRGGKYETPNHKVPMIIVENDPDNNLQKSFKLAESVAICRYIEEQLQKKYLFGENPKQRSLIEMWNRRVDLEYFIGAVGKSWIHGPVLKALRDARNIKHLPSEFKNGMKLSHSFYREVNDTLSQQNFLAGDCFSIADISFLCVFDFASGPVGIKPNWEKLPHLKAWHQRVSKRASVQLHKNPYIKEKERYGEEKNMSRM